MSDHLPSLSVIVSPVNVAKLTEELAHHPNNDYKLHLINGFLHGFDTMVTEVDLPTKECRNLQSTRDIPHIVTRLIDSEVQKGFLAGPYVNPPFPNYRVSPIGVVEGKYSKKQRLIVDLSAPHNNNSGHTSINDLIEKGSSSLSYVTIDDAIWEIVKQGKGARRCKVDI